MKNGMVQKTLFAIVMIVVIASVIVVNRKVTQQLNDIEQGYMTTTQEKVEPTQQTRLQAPKPSPVKIDPANDPLAPRKKKSSPTKSAPSTVPVVFEEPMDTAIFVQ